MAEPNLEQAALDAVRELECGVSRSRVRKGLQDAGLSDDLVQEILERATEIVDGEAARQKARRKHINQATGGALFGIGLGMLVYVALLPGASFHLFPAGLLGAGAYLFFATPLKF
ncbi:MAG: hypothetical protein ACOCX4_05070 [Planctomycetota bacterium]